MLILKRPVTPKISPFIPRSLSSNCYWFLHYRVKAVLVFHLLSAQTTIQSRFWGLSISLKICSPKHGSFKWSEMLFLLWKKIALRVSAESCHQEKSEAEWNIQRLLLGTAWQDITNTKKQASIGWTEHEKEKNKNVISVAAIKPGGLMSRAVSSDNQSIQVSG